MDLPNSLVPTAPGLSVHLTSRSSRLNLDPSAHLETDAAPTQTDLKPAVLALCVYANGTQFSHALL